MNNEQFGDSVVQALTAQSDSLMELMRGFDRNLPWVLILVISIAVMQLINVVVIMRSRKGARGYRGHDRDRDRRPGAQAGAEDKQGKGQSSAARRPDWAPGQKKPGDSRGGKPQQGQGDRQRQGQSGRSGQQSVNQMELSLRDINQRLKNAEREQDNARKSIRDGEDGDGRDRDRDGRQQRGGRDGGRDGGGRNDRGPRRDGGRDNRNRDGGRPPRDRGQFKQDDAGHGTPPQERPTAPEIVPNDMGVPEDQLQHGRRFAAKRRVLPDTADGPDVSAGGSFDAPEQNQSSVFDNVGNTQPETPTTDFGRQEQPETQDPNGNETIQFGR